MSLTTERIARRRSSLVGGSPDASRATRPNTGNSTRPSGLPYGAASWRSASPWRCRPPHSTAPPPSAPAPRVCIIAIRLGSKMTKRLLDLKCNQSKGEANCNGIPLDRQVGILAKLAPHVCHQSHPPTVAPLRRRPHTLHPVPECRT